MDKVCSSTAVPVTETGRDERLTIGGSGLSGLPPVPIDALQHCGDGELDIASSNCGVDDGHLRVLPRDHRMSSPYVGGNKEFARQFPAGELQVEQGPRLSLAEWLRAGGAVIPAFYTPASVGTAVAEGELPWRYAPDGSVAVASPAKKLRGLDGRPCVLEQAVRTGSALVRAAAGDRHGNRVHSLAVANLNPLCAAAGRITIAGVGALAEPGEIPSSVVHTPGVFVHLTAAPVIMAAESAAVARPGSLS